MPNFIPDFIPDDKKTSTRLPVFNPFWLQNLYGSTPNPQPRESIPQEETRGVQNSPVNPDYDMPNARASFYDKLKASGIYPKLPDYDTFSQTMDEDYEAVDTIYEDTKDKLNITKEQITSIFDNPRRVFYEKAVESGADIENRKKEQKDFYNTLKKSKIYPSLPDYDTFSKTMNEDGAVDAVYEDVKNLGVSKEYLSDLFDFRQLNAITVPKTYSEFEQEMKNPEKLKEFHKQLNASGLYRSEIPFSEMQDIFADAIDEGGTSIGSYGAFSKLGEASEKLRKYDAANYDPREDNKNYSMVGALSRTPTRKFNRTPEIENQIKAFEKGRAPFVAEFEKNLAEVKSTLETLKKNIATRQREAAKTERSEKRKSGWYPPAISPGSIYLKADRDINPANKDLERMMGLVNDAIKYVNAPTKESSIALWKGMKKADYANILTTGLKGVSDAAGMLALAQKQQRGEELTETERSVLSAHYVLESLQSSIKPTNTYIAGTAAVESLGFMAQIMFGGWALKGTMKGIEKGSTKLLRNMAFRKLPKYAARDAALDAKWIGTAGKWIGNTAGAVIGAGIQSPTMPMFYSEGMTRMLGSLERTDTGDLVFKNAPPAEKAWMQAWLETTGEVLGEYSGAWMSKAARALGFGIGRAPKSWWADMQKQMMFDGLVFETLEEYVTKAWQTAFVGDQEWRDFFNKDEFIQIVSSVGLMSAVMGLGNGAVMAGNQRKRRAAQKKYYTDFSEQAIRDLDDALVKLKQSNPDMFVWYPDVERATTSSVFTDLIENPNISLDDKFKIIRQLPLTDSQAKTALNYVAQKNIADITGAVLEQFTKRELSPMVNQQTGKIVTGVYGDEGITVLRQDGGTMLIRTEVGQEMFVPSGSVKIVESKSPEEIARQAAEAAEAGADAANSLADAEEIQKIISETKQDDTVHDENGDEWKVEEVQEEFVDLRDEQGRTRQVPLPEFVEWRRTETETPAMTQERQAAEQQRQQVAEQQAEQQRKDRVAKLKEQAPRQKNGDIDYEALLSENPDSYVELMEDAFPGDTARELLEKDYINRQGEMLELRKQAMEKHGNEFIAAGVRLKELNEKQEKIEEIFKKKYGQSPLDRAMRDMEKSTKTESTAGTEGTSETKEKPDGDLMWDAIKLENSMRDAKSVEELKRIKKEIDGILEKVKDKNGYVYKDLLKDVGIVYGKTEKALKSDETKTETGEDTRKESPQPLSEEQANALIAQMEQNATEAPAMELTPENWYAEFGEDGMVETPVGEVKMGENQYLKLQAKDRGAQFGMVKPTLTNPDIIIEQQSEQEGAERNSVYLFVKTFNVNGEKIRHFESVTVSQDKKEVVVSNHIIKAKQLLDKLKAGNVVYKSTALDASGQTSAEYTPQTESGAPSNDGGKGTSKNLNERKKIAALENEIAEYIDYSIDKFGKFGKEGEFDHTEDVAEQFLDKVLRMKNRNSKGLYGYVKNRGESGFVKSVHEYLKLKTGSGLWKEKEDTGTANNDQKKSEKASRQRGEDPEADRVDDIKAAFGGMVDSVEPDSVNAVVQRLEKEGSFTMRVPDAIAKAKASPRYNYTENGDGTINVIGILGMDNQWHGQAPETSSQKNNSETSERYYSKEVKNPDGSSHFRIYDSETGQPASERAYKRQETAEREVGYLNGIENTKGMDLETLRSLPLLPDVKTEEKVDPLSVRAEKALTALSEIDFNTPASARSGANRIVSIISGKHVPAIQVGQALNTKAGLIGNNDYYTPEYLEKYIHYSTKDTGVYRKKPKTIYDAPVHEKIKALGEPQSREEAIALLILGGAKIRWSDKLASGGISSKGFGSHLGYGEKERKQYINITNNEEGLTPEQFAEYVESEDTSGLFSNMDTMEIMDVVLNVLGNVNSTGAAFRYVYDARQERVEDEQRRMESEMEQAEMDAYEGFTREEYEAILNERYKDVTDEELREVDRLFAEAAEAENFYESKENSNFAENNKDNERQGRENERVDADGERKGESRSDSESDTLNAGDRTDGQKNSGLHDEERQGGSGGETGVRGGREHVGTGNSDVPGVGGTQAATAGDRTGSAVGKDNGDRRGSETPGSSDHLGTEGQITQKDIDNRIVVSGARNGFAVFDNKNRNNKNAGTDRDVRPSGDTYNGKRSVDGQAVKKYHSDKPFTYIYTDAQTGKKYLVAAAGLNAYYGQSEDGRFGNVFVSVEYADDLPSWTEEYLLKKAVELYHNEFDGKVKEVFGKIPAVEFKPEYLSGFTHGAGAGRSLRVPEFDVTDSLPNKKQNDIAEAEKQVNTNPTDAQKEAGNYKKGHVNVHGFDISIEQPKGSTRSGVDANGKKWSVTMNNTYGYIRGTEGRDHDQIDVFIGENPENGKIFVVDQTNPNTGAFDEHKVMLGFDSIEQARDAYLSNYEKGWQGLENITETNIEDFRKWADMEGRRIKPFAEYKSVRFQTVRDNSLEAVNSRFNEELDNFAAKTHRGLLHLGKPLAILKAAGINAEELTLSPSVLHTHLKKHSLTTEDLKGLAKAIQNPFFVYEHGLNNPNIVIITETDVRGRKLSVSVELDRSGNVVEVNNISSVHGKDAAIELERLSDAVENKKGFTPKWVSSNENVLSWLGIAPLNGGSYTGNSKHISLAKVIRNFKNPNLSDSRQQKSTSKQDFIPISRKQLKSFVAWIKKNKLAKEVIIEGPEMREYLETHFGKDGAERFMTVWHGTGANFERFKKEFMLTGEGNMIYGHGFYFTELEEIAKGYARSKIDLEALKYRIDNRINHWERRDKHTGFTERMHSEPHASGWKAVEMTDEQYEKAKTEYENNRRRLLKVKIHGDKTVDELNFIRWDKELSNRQRQQIISAIDALPEYDEETDTGFDWESKGEAEGLFRGKMRGDQVLGTLDYLIGSNNDAEVSKFLLDAGIDGIQYPTDYLSDQSDKGTYNYVVFDENVIEITDKIRLMSTSNGEVYGFVTKDGVIYLDPDRMNANTPIHEFGHLWNTYIQKYNKPLWKRGVEIAKQSEYWAEVSKTPEAFGLAKNASENDIADEVLSRMYGDRGEALFHEKGLGEKLRAWLHDVWTWLGSRLGIRDLTVEKMQNLTLEQFIDGAVADILSGKPIPGSLIGVSKVLGDEKSLKDNRTSRYQFIGEKGAAALDKAEEATTRMYNLNVAREMETAGKKAKAIKLATGWERGADGKWRYEITYIELNDRGMEIYEEYYHKKAETSIKSVKLSEILDAKELFGAYPQFASKYVWLSKSEDGKASGEYDPSNESISVKVTPYRSRFGKKRTEFETTLAHEIQHAIQHVEGFERGDNSTRKEGSKVGEMRKKWVESKQAVYYMEDWDLYGGILDSFASDFAKAQISSVRHMRRADAIKELEKRAEEYNTKLMEAIAAERELPEIGYDKYMRNAGEVEARNVQTRMGALPKKRALLAETTEDVAREDQLFLYDALGEQAMTDKNPDSSRKNSTFAENNERTVDGLEIIETPKHDFKNISEAKAWAKENITGTYHNTDTDEDISVSRTAIDKYLSEKAISKSVNLDAHLSALKQIPKLLETSVLTERTPDKNESQSILEIQRLYGKINYNGNIYPVKTTVKAVRNEGNRAYSYEVMEIESPTENLSGNSNKMGLGNGAQYTTNPDLSSIEERSPSTHNRQSVTEDGTSKFRDKGTNISENSKHTGKNPENFVSDENARFHVEADKEAGEISNWLDELENSGRETRFSLAPNLPNKNPDPHFVTASRVRELLQDNAIKLRRWEEELKKRGAKISIDQSSYEKIDLVAPKVMAKTDRMGDELYKPLAETAVEMRKKHGIEWDDIGRYLIARHAPERNAYLKAEKNVDDGSGMTDADAAKTVADFENKVPKALVDELNKQIAAIRDFNLDNLLFYELITKAKYDELKKRYKYYVPLKGWETGEAGEELQRYIDDGRATGGGVRNLTRKAEGRKSMADNPIDNMLHYSMNLISAGEKNRVKQAAYYIASANKGNDDLYTLDFIPKQNIEQYKIKQKEVEVWINGEMHIIFFQQAELANILNGARGREIRNASWHNSYPAKLTRFMSAIQTAKNPSFAIANTTRDFQQGAQRILIEDGAAMLGKFLRLESTAVRMLYRDVMRDKTIKKEISGRDIYGAKKTWKVADLYEEFLMSGAVTGYIQDRRMEDVKKNMQKELKRAAGGVWPGRRAWDTGNRWLNNLAEVSENSTRFAAYMAYRTSGYTMAESARKAKEITVNFNRKGEATTMIGAGVAFFNASIQAAENTLSLAAHHKKAFAVMSVLHAAKGYLAYQLSAWILQKLADGADDDDEKSRMAGMLTDLNDWRKYTNMMLPIFFGDKDKFVLLPLSHTWRPFHALGVMAAQLENKTITAKEAAKNMASIASGSISPFDITDARSFIPTSISPITDIWWLGTDFMGIPLHKEMYTTDLEENTKALHKAMPGTSPVFTGVSKLAARMAGYDPENPSRMEMNEAGELKELSGLLNINPTHLEHLVRNYTGGVGKFLVDTYTTMRGIVEGGISFVRGEESAEFFPEGANRIPVFNRFVHKPYNGSYHSREFYKMRKFLYNWENTFYDKQGRENKAVTGEKVDATNSLLNKMYNYDADAGILSDDIKYKQEQIKATKETLKTVIPKTEKLRYEAEIKKLEDEIEAAKKKRIGLYRKAYGEMNPLFEKLKISYQ